MIRVLIMAVTMLLAFTSASQADVIDIGAAFGSFGPYINSAISALITGGVGWVLYLVQSKVNISIDDSMRDALQTWLQRQAASLVADGAVKLNGMQVSVSNTYLAAAANLAIKEIPDAINFFGLSPDKLAAMITDLLPHVPTVAAVAAAQVTAAAAAPAAAAAAAKPAPAPTK